MKTNNKIGNFFIVVIFFLFTPLISFGDECIITYKMLYAIAKNEKHKHRDVGYPYLISFNNKSDIKKLQNADKKMMLDNRTMDCQNREYCTYVASYLIESGVKNMDVGPFQICYMYHKNKMSLDQFFSLKDSFEFAKKFSEQNTRVHGCTWKALARYHSATPSHNNKYAKGLKNVYFDF